MNTARLISAAAAATLIALPLGGFAQTRTMNPSGPYVGAGATYSFFDEGPIDDDRAGFKVYGGWQFTPVLGAELSYANFGEFEDGAASADIDTVGVAATAGFPVTPNFNPYAKIGRHWWDAETNVANTDDNDMFYGVGAKFPINEAVALRVEAERYEVADADVDALSLSAQMDF